jgi:hypothetical protein
MNTFMLYIVNFGNLIVIMIFILQRRIFKDIQDMVYRVKSLIEFLNKFLESLKVNNKVI